MLSMTSSLCIVFLLKLYISLSILKSPLHIKDNALLKCLSILFSFKYIYALYILSVEKFLIVISVFLPCLGHRYTLGELMSEYENIL